MSSAPRKSTPHILAIDMGTGTAKAALVSPRGRIAGSGARGIETEQLPGGGAEQDPEDWWQAVTGAAREALDRSELPPESVVAVRCTTQWATTVPVDAEGRALSRALLWMDSRGGPYVRALVDGPVRLAGYNVRKLHRWIRLTGGVPLRSGIDGLGHLLYLKHERPDVYAAAATFLEPMDYLNLRLTGRAAASYGSIYPYWLTDNRDVERVSYDPVLVRWAGIDREKLPELRAVDAVLGTLTQAAAGQLGLRPETRVLGGLSDAQAAMIGAGIVEPGRGYFSIGTTSWLSCQVPAKKTDLRHLIATMPAALPGRHMVVAEQGAAGRCLELLKDNLLYAAARGEPPPPADVYERLDRAAASVPAGSGGLIFTPWLGGVAAPADDPYTRSAFFNQSLDTTRAHYVRAVMEGVAYNLRWLKHHVERFADSSFGQLNFIGGGALSSTWCQILADVLGCRIGQVDQPRYASAVGAALAGFVALGEIDGGEIPAAVELTAVYDPDPADRSVHDRQFEHFLRLYRTNKRLYRRLNAVRR